MLGRRGLLGHPPGLYILFFTEMWERFSFYGMRALLVFYMTKHLLFAQQTASHIYGLYGGLVYFTPLFGGWLADRRLGPHRCVVIGGAVITSDTALWQKIKFYQNAAGAVPGPWDAWLVLRGIKTLAIRMREHAHNALALAKLLEEHPAVERVYYPGLDSHPQHSLAVRQMSGFGGMISLELKGGVTAINQFVARTKLFVLGESLGGVESLVCYPTQMTHAALGADVRAQRGIRDNLLRLSVGIEHLRDLTDDLLRAL